MTGFRINSAIPRLMIGLAMAAAPALALAQRPDAVLGSRGTTTYGTVTAVTRTQVTVDSQQGKKLFPTNEIRRLSYGGEPAELKHARESIERGQFESARSDLEKISTDGITRPEMLQDIEFYKGYCDGRVALAGGGDKGTAVRELRAFVENAANQDSYHYFAAAELLGDLAVALSSYENGIKYYRLLGEAPWPDYKMRAAVQEARAMVESGQFAEALKKYESVLASGVDDARAREQKLLASLGKAVCLAETGKPEDGISLAQQIIAEYDSQQNPVLFARAYNTLGRCYLRAKKPQDALLAYLHVDLLFNQDADAHAEALYHLSQLWRTVNKSERAIRAHSLLKSRYAGTSWASRK